MTLKYVMAAAFSFVALEAAQAEQKEGNEST